MALLSTADQTNLQGAIDLMVKSGTCQWPLADDVIGWLTKLATNTSLAGFRVGTSGAVKDAFRDNPLSASIALVAICGQHVLSHADYDSLVKTVLDIYTRQAYERPQDAGVVDLLCPVAHSTGFMTTGKFKDEMANSPFSTLFSWALFLGKQ